ncbi:MAG: hypothetical protein HY822_13790, partial [Acidobacteria bacterium]|nr:hypothetical protein [Acidobacteriota bacterium]
GELLGAGSPIESVEVVRALHVALSAIDLKLRRVHRADSLPDNAGQPWLAELDRRLAQSFDAGNSVPEIARVFQRTPGSIAARLVRIGKVTDRQSAFAANSHATASKGEQ